MTDSNGVKKRVTCKRPHPNQRLQGLLESLYREAVDAKSTLVPALKEAIASLEKYPLPLTSGAECAILKGFDAKLCKYIDLHLKELSRNKKSRGNENVSPYHEIERPSTSVENNSDSKMASASKKHRKKNKRLVTSMEKCPFSSNFGESRNNNTANTDVTSKANANSSMKKNTTLNNHNSTIQSATNREKNNNVGISECPDDVCTRAEGLDTYFVNKSRRDAAYKGDTPLFLTEKVQNDCLNNANFTLCENWESFTNDDCHQFKYTYDEEIRKCYLQDQVVDISEDSGTDESVTEINSSSDEEITSQPIQLDCHHKDEVVYCKQCESITTAADAFQLYYKDKVKRDAEEIEKCILPRKMYKPAYRSGAYAIIVALLEQRNECPYRDSLTKDELIQKAQKHTDQSFTGPNFVSDYTAWTNAKRLINKGMIQITNCDHRGEDVYMLTAMGRAVAMELLKQHTPKVTINDVIYHGQRNDRVPSLEDVVLMPPPPLVSVNEEQSSVFIEMPPGTFDIVMLIDKRENLKTYLPSSPNNYCKYESRSISIGDFLWVARSKKTGQELVLPYIVERKRMDDLSSSIKDGRYNEQKFRLRKCGLRNVIYLIENFNPGLQQGLLPPSALTQAIVNTSVMDDFNVIKTESVEHTFRFLGMLSESLVHEFLPIFLRGSNRDTQGRELMTFDFFNKFSCKNKPLTIKDTFIKMLLQLKGLSVEKALAITKKYDSPRALMKAYERCNTKEGELLLANLKFNNFTRNVGPAKSLIYYKDLFVTL